MKGFQKTEKKLDTINMFRYMQSISYTNMACIKFESNYFVILL